MKKTLIFALLILAFVLVACKSDSATEAPEVAPTATAMMPESTSTEVPATEPPATSGDPVWDRVQAAGKIVFGTSADYPPFEYYDSSYTIVGFDAALARNLGERLGLDVEMVDFAFEGLPAALQTGQIDAAIAAISVTPERQSIMDFTNVYYSGQDSVLAREDSDVEKIVAPAQLAQYRVGVQRGSIYSNWIEDILVVPGLMPERNLLQYAKPEDAVRDLRENRNDLVILDKLAADEYRLEGGVISVGQNLNTQLFAIGIPKGSVTLQAALNNALIELQNNGTVARLTKDFLDIEVPPVQPTPVPTATAIPGPTATPAGCFNGMQFVSDVQIPDGTEIKAGQDFDKIWRIRNTGTCTWNTNYRLVFVQGDRMDGTSEPVTQTVRPGETYDMIIDQRAPDNPGKYTGVWQLTDENKTPFGERIWVKITVPGAVKPTAAPPTATSVPPVQPTLGPSPAINYLRVSDSTVQPGDLVVVSWSYSGEALASARLTRTNPDGSQTPLMGGADVNYDDQYEDILMNPGTYSYTLNVSAENGTTAVKTVTVQVVESSAGASIDYLTASSANVQQGDLLILNWSFTGTDLATARITRTNPDGSQTALYGGADVDFQGQYEDLMMNPGKYIYTLTVSTESGNTVTKTIEVNVSS